MVIGGILVQREHEHRLRTALQQFRNEQQMRAELKWTKVSNQKLAQYQALVELYFRFSSTARFKAIVVDTSEIDHQRYNKGDAELGFYKLMYQFLLHSFGRELRQDDRCIIYVDERTTSRYKLSTLASVLNNGMRKKYGFTHQPVRNIQPLNSKREGFVQVADVLMGAIGYQMNGGHLHPGARHAKIALAECIASEVGISSLTVPTPPWMRNFSVWHFHFRHPRT
jgi:hypothetical protein